MCECACTDNIYGSSPGSETLRFGIVIKMKKCFVFTKKLHSVHVGKLWLKGYNTKLLLIIKAIPLSAINNIK